MTWPTEYACAPGIDTTAGPYGLRPISWNDRQSIRLWRNAQLDVLRQREPLSDEEQDRYFRDVVEPQFSAAKPAQVLAAVTVSGELIGYGGVVHIDWDDRRGEVSFLTDPLRLDDETFSADWRAYLRMLVPMARETLRLRRLTTEAYASRLSLFPLLEEAGFVNEGTVRNSRTLDGQWIDSVIHGLAL